jgi:hypothetical protein
MSKGFIIAFAVGLLVVACVIGGVFYTKKGTHLEPRGSILKVRTQAIDDKNSIAVLEVRLVNDSDVQMIVRQIEVNLETKEGHQLPGAIVAGGDAKSVFQYYPQLGEQFNEPLMAQDRVRPHETIDRMLAVRFETPDATLQERKKITVRVEDTDGPVAEFSSGPH